MIDPVSNFLARRRQTSLARIEQSEQCGDGLFFGHETPPLKNLADCSNKPARSELSAVGVAVPSAFSV
jgi:hypothetical protein